MKKENNQIKIYNKKCANATNKLKKEIQLNQNKEIEKKKKMIESSKDLEEKNYQ